MEYPSIPFLDHHYYRYGENPHGHKRKDHQRDSHSGVQDKQSYYIGSGLLAQGKSDLAFPYLNAVKPGSPYQEKAQWYILLISLLASNWNTARGIIDNLSEQDPTIHRKDLEEIDKFLKTQN